MKNLILVILFAIGIQNTTFAQKDTIYVYGPGGPYPAMNDIAKEFSKIHNITVIVNKGPVSKWEMKAKKNADIIYSGSEYMMTDFTKKFRNIKTSTISPLYLRKSGVLVRPGNPKGIHSLLDLLKPDIHILVVTGAGLTGVWETMIGKTKDIDKLKALRKNITFFAANSGVANKKWIDDKKIDVWVTWNIWQISNSSLADFIPVKEKYTVYRDCGIALTTKGSNSKNAKEFFNFVQSQRVQPIFKKWGWKTSKE